MTSPSRRPPRGNGAASLARLAWRNLWRQRRRTLLLVVVVAYATLAIVFFWGFVDGFLDSIMNAQGRLIAAPVLITTERYHGDPDPSNAMASSIFAAVRLAVAEALGGSFSAMDTSTVAVDVAPSLSRAVSVTV